MAHAQSPGSPAPLMHQKGGPTLGDTTVPLPCETGGNPAVEEPGFLTRACGVAVRHSPEEDASSTPRVTWDPRFLFRVWTAQGHTHASEMLCF